MKKLAVDLCLEPLPYVHHCTRDWNLPELEYRWACLCGYRSEWTHLSAPWQEVPDHPHGQVTISRTELVPLIHPSNQGANR